jgi:hypothetical protein
MKRNVSFSIGVLVFLMILIGMWTTVWNMKDMSGPDPAETGAVPVSSVPSTIRSGSGAQPLSPLGADVVGSWDTSSDEFESIALDPDGTYRMYSRNRLIDAGKWIAQDPDKLWLQSAAGPDNDVHYTNIHATDQGLTLYNEGVQDNVEWHR